MLDTATSRRRKTTRNIPNCKSSAMSYTKKYKDNIGRQHLAAPTLGKETIEKDIAKLRSQSRNTDVSNSQDIMTRPLWVSTWDRLSYEPLKINMRVHKTLSETKHRIETIDRAHSASKTLDTSNSDHEYCGLTKGQNRPNSVHRSPCKINISVL